MKKAGIGLILIAILAVAGYFGYSYWQDTVVYFKTENASVTANTVSITPLISGNIAFWLVKEGDEVQADQVLGRQELGNLVQSSSMNSQSLGSSAGATIARADIKTPIAGKVVQSNVVVGEAVAPGMQLAVIADTRHMFIRAYVEEHEVNRIQVGQPVEITIDAYPGVDFHGYVESVGEATQSAFSTLPSFNTSGTFTKVTQLIPIKITVAGLETYKLRLGYNATVKIKTQ